MSANVNDLLTALEAMSKSAMENNPTGTDDAASGGDVDKEKHEDIVKDIPNAPEATDKPENHDGGEGGTNTKELQDEPRALAADDPAPQNVADNPSAERLMQGKIATDLSDDELMDKVAAVLTSINTLVAGTKSAADDEGGSCDAEGTDEPAEDHGNVDPFEEGNVDTGIPMGDAESDTKSAAYAAAWQAETLARTVAGAVDAINIKRAEAGLPPADVEAIVADLEGGAEGGVDPAAGQEGLGDEEYAALLASAGIEDDEEELGDPPTEEEIADVLAALDDDAEMKSAMYMAMNADESVKSAFIKRAMDGDLGEPPSEEELADFLASLEDHEDAGVPAEALVELLGQPEAPEDSAKAMAASSESDGEASEPSGEAEGAGAADGDEKVAAIRAEIGKLAELLNKK